MSILTIFLLFICPFTFADVLTDIQDELKAHKANVNFYQNLAQTHYKDYQTTKDILNKSPSYEGSAILETKRKNFQATVDNLKIVTDRLNIKTKIYDSLLSDPAPSDCHSGLKEIDLELEGKSFHNIPVDYQGQFGTCYANTTKNILVSLLKGKGNPSFLDLAVHSKDEKSLLNNGLDSGGVCGTLQAVTKVGYCPQSLAKNESIKDEMDSRLLWDVLGFRKLGLLLSNHKASNLENFEGSFDLIFPVNELDWKNAFSTNPRYQNYYYHYYDQFLTAEWKTRQKLIEDMYNLKVIPSETSFCEEYINYLKPVLNNFKINANDISPGICKIFRPTPYLRDFFKLKDSTQSLGEFLLVHQIAEMKKIRPELDTKNLISEMQKNTPHELVTSAFAPECNSKENRIFFERSFYCEEDFYKSRKAKFSGIEFEGQVRERILMHLHQGYAVANTTYGHLNTIVGYRWNNQAKFCEFKIRESQLGKSIWESEKKIIRNMQEFTEVRN